MLKLRTYNFKSYRGLQTALSQTMGGDALPTKTLRKYHQGHFSVMIDDPSTVVRPYRVWLLPHTGEDHRFVFRMEYGLPMSVDIIVNMEGRPYSTRANKVLHLHDPGAKPAILDIEKQLLTFRCQLKRLKVENGYQHRSPSHNDVAREI